MQNITINQKTINLIIIAGVAVMAIGAWTMPMYNAQLAHDDATEILTKVKEVKTDTGELDKGLTGGKDLGKANLVSLLTADKDKSTLSKVLGDDFTTFQSSFLGTQKKADSNSAGVEIKKFSAAIPRSILFKNTGDDTVLNPENIVDSTATCNTAGTQIGSSSTKPQQLLGFAIVNRDGAQNTVRVQVCGDSGGSLNGDTIVDEVISLPTQNEIFTKNFDFGVVPPGSDLRIEITDGDADATNHNYDFWLLMGDPEKSFQVSTFSGVSNPCNSITIEVHDGDGVVSADEAIVEVSHETVPFFDSQPTGSDGKVTFNGPLPPGLYFIDVFPGTGSGFPTFVDKSCSGGASLSLTGANKVTLGSITTLTSDGKGDLKVTIVDENGSPVTNTNNFVDHNSLPVINDVCNDGTVDTSDDSATKCEAIFEDEIFSGQASDLTEGTGTFTIKNLPTGTYFIESCTNTFQCGFIQAAVEDTKTTSVTVEIFAGTSVSGGAGGAN